MTITEKKISFAACSLSVLFSLWVSFLGGTINLDGILYIGVAEHLLQGDVSGAAKLYNWFFYPLCIAGVSKVSGLALETSAYLLTALFSALLTYAFLSCVSFMGARGNYRILLWAAFVIVFHPALMEKRAEIIRDHGYLSFYLLAICCFLKFYKEGQWRHALGWGLSMVLAALFRVEGFILLLLLPLSLVLRRNLSWSSRVSRFVSANLVSLLLLLLISSLFLLTPSFSEFFCCSRLGEIFPRAGKFINVFAGGLVTKVEVLEKGVLPAYSENYAMPVLLMIPAVILIDKLIGGLTLVYGFCLSWQPLRYTASLKKEVVPALFWLLVLNFSLLIIFVYAEYHLQKRFVFPIVLILLLPLPFILEQHFAKWRSEKFFFAKKNWLIYLVLIIILGQSLDGLLSNSRQSTSYIREAGFWLRHNMPVRASLYTNNPKIYYYSEQMDDYWGRWRPPRVEFSLELLQGNPWRGKDFIALWVGHRVDVTEEQISVAIGYKPQKLFANSRNDRVIVYKAR